MDTANLERMTSIISIDTTRSEAKEEAKSDSETVGQDKPVLEAIAAKAMPKEDPEPTIEEEHHYHRGR